MKAEGGQTWDITEIKRYLKLTTSQENLSMLFYNAKISWQKIGEEEKKYFIIAPQRGLIDNV